MEIIFQEGDSKKAPMVVDRLQLKDVQRQTASVTLKQVDQRQSWQSWMDHRVCTQRIWEITRIQIRNNVSLPKHPKHASIQQIPWQLWFLEGIRSMPVSLSQMSTKGPRDQDAAASGSSSESIGST